MWWFGLVGSWGFSISGGLTSLEVGGDGQIWSSDLAGSWWFAGSDGFPSSEAGGLLDLVVQPCRKLGSLDLVV